MITRDQALAKLQTVLTDVDVAVALAHSMKHYAITCEERGYRIPPKTLKLYASRIVEELCATEEQDDAKL